MAILSLVVSGFLFFLVIVLGFENITGSCAGVNILFSSFTNFNTAFLVWLIAFLGILAGVFLTIAINSFLSAKEEKDDASYEE